MCQPLTIIGGVVIFTTALGVHYTADSLHRMSFSTRLPGLRDLNCPVTLQITLEFALDRAIKNSQIKYLLTQRFFQHSAMVNFSFQSFVGNITFLCYETFMSYKPSLYGIILLLTKYLSKLKIIYIYIYTSIL